MEVALRGTHQVITTNTPTKTFRISDVKGLDPITVYFDDHEPGRGTLTVRCFDRAWTCYWGSMGDGSDLARFIGRSVDAGYIANCLARGNLSVITKRQIEYLQDAYLLRIAQAVKDAVVMGAAAGPVPSSTAVAAIAKTTGSTS